MRCTVSVTATNIKRGKPEQGGCCPIALAVKSLLLKKRSVIRVFADFVRFNRVIGHANLPKSARTFIRRFDRARPVGPFKFTLNIPSTHLLRRVAKAN